MIDVKSQRQSSRRVSGRMVVMCGLVSALTVAIAVGGDLERVGIYRAANPCIQQGGGSVNCTDRDVEATERWPSCESGSIDWRVAVGPSIDDIAPGFSICGTIKSSPGFRGARRASKAWNDISLLPSCYGVQPLPMGFVSTVHLNSPRKIAQAVGPIIPPSGSSEPGWNMDENNVVAFLDDADYISMNLGAPSDLLVVTLVRTLTTICNSNKPFGPTDPCISPPLPADTCFDERNYALIVEADIILNASGDADNNDRAYFSWVEWYSDGNVYATFNGSQFEAPSEAYCDIEGILTHEFGHVLGLGHSVIDSMANASGTEFPTMFPFAQVEPFDEMIAVDCQAPSFFSANASSTTVGGILGKSARTLEQDDIAAIGRGYPTPDFAQYTGTIVGNVGHAGASIVAISVDCPEVRIGTLSYHEIPDAGATVGDYELSGLPTGDYYLFVEPVDTDVYFADGSAPNYLVLLQGRPDCGPQGVNLCKDISVGGLETAPPSFVPEFWNVNDALSEQSQTATLVSIVAGETVECDFVLDLGTPNTPILEVSRNNAPICMSSGFASNYSMRGVRVGAGGQAHKVTFRVTTDPSDAGKEVKVRLRYDLDNIIVNGQLRQVAVTGGWVTIEDPVDSLGEVFGDYCIRPEDAYRNIFAQAMIHEPGNSSTKVFTNTVNVWVTDENYSPPPE